MGHKNSKGNVSLTNYKGRIRLRWRYQSIRYSLNLLSYNRTNLLAAKKTALQIEQDMANEKFDHSLNSYKGEQRSMLLVEKTIVEYFEEWTSNIRQMDCEVHTNYNSVRNMLKKWKAIEQHNIAVKLNAEIFCAGTYYRRLTMLRDFVNWLIKKGVWSFNALEDIKSKRIKKVKLDKRKPFSPTEIKSILDAFKDDIYTPKSSSFKHSHYYPFIYFIFKPIFK